MDPMTIGTMLGGAGQFAGGIASLFRGSPGTDWTQVQLQREFFDKNAALQKEFAQSGIRWRVADAQAAGIHPLYALGGSGASYSPTPYQVMDSRSSGPDVGGALSNMGQGIGRAVAATQTQKERELTAFEVARQEQQLTMGRQQIELNALQLQKVASDLALRNQAGNGPGMPGALFTMKPAEVTHTGAPGHTAAPPEGNPLSTAYVDPYGGRTSLPQKDVNIDEVSSPGWFSYAYTNRVLPFMDQIMGRRSPAAPPDSDLPPGASHWHFAFPGRWIPVYPTLPRGDRGHMWNPYAGTRYKSLPPVYERD